MGAVICCFGRRIWRISVLHRLIVTNGRSILTACLGNCGYSSMIQHQISTSDSFLKISCSVEAGPASMNTSHSVTFESTGLLAPWIDLLRMHDSETTFTWSSGKHVSLSYADLPNVGTSHYTIFKNNIINITTNYIRKIFKYQETLMWKF